MTSNQNQCFHCDLEIDTSLDIHVYILGENRAMCCAGCAAVAQAIVKAKLESYYTHRTQASTQGEQLIPEQLQELKLYDNPQIQKTFVHQTREHCQQATLILEGITCAACVWLNKQHLSNLDGILNVDINYTTLKASVQWDERKISLSEILKAIALIGYTGHPYDPNQRHAIIERMRKETLKRLGIAGGFGMQVMALAISLYLDDGTMDKAIKLLIERASFVLTLPVIFYAAQPFYQSALTDFKNRRFGMDTPVAIGISLAFIASVITLITNQGEIYFDSVCMFTFFLLGAKYLEIAARKRAADNADIINQTKPVLARRVRKDGSTDMIPALELNVGDTVLVYAGDTLPADGYITRGESHLDESVLSGESKPQFKSAFSKVIGGSINIDSPITVEISQVGNQTILAGIQRLLDNAQQARPGIAQMADKVAAWFILAILSLASLTALFWFQHSPDDWLAPTIAVLIVSCPCALSLATPASITTAIGRLMKEGAVVCHKDALENLHKLNVMFFDKTGTLTEGKLKIEQYHVLNASYSNSHFDICSAIEQHSEHPIASAFVQHKTPLQVSEAQNTPGKGLTAMLDNASFYVGTAAYIKAKTGHSLDKSSEQEYAHFTQVVLADSNGIIALYGLTDSLRPHSKAMIVALNQANIDTIMLTGDNASAANHIAEQLGIQTVFADQLPADKLNIIRQYQTQNNRSNIVGMVGDGVNDAAVLAGADCAISTQGASSLASASSDILLLSSDLNVIHTAVKVANKTHAIIKQNLIWALAYNITAIPAAAMGFVPPWLAAIGMSVSSLLVVLNALRLKR